MKIKFIKLFAFLIFCLPLNALGDGFTIRLSSFLSPTEISIELIFKFDQPSVIYHWSPAKSLYPILNCGLFIECRELKSNKNVSFMPYEKVLPKLPHELDVLEVKEYKEVLKVIPGENYNISSLKKGRYSLKLVYDTEALRKYPSGKMLTPMKIESNELFFEIKGT